MNMTARVSLRRFVHGASITCAVVAVAVAAASAATATASSARAPAVSWRIAGTLRNEQGLALAPVSRTSAWVFAEAGTGNAAPTARLLTGDSLKQYPFPGKRGELITDAAASAPDNVWAVSTYRVFAWDGSAWRVMHSFGQSDYLYSVLPIGPANVLVFTEDGTWHYGRSGWARQPTGDGLTSGSELSSDSIWAVERGGKPDVAHWNGQTWKRTSLADLLPRSPKLCDYGLTGVQAVSATNVWVTASGNCQDSSGPLLVLHYSDHRWARAPLAGSYGTAQAVATDGSRALWLEIWAGDGGNETLYQYSAGRMYRAVLPVPHARAFLMEGLTSAYALMTNFRVAFADPTAYLLRYGR
jgi:hypothetical protein